MSTMAADEKPVQPLKTSKRINTPFLAQKKYKAELANPSPEPISNVGPSIKPFDIIRWSVMILLASLVLSKMITETWLWDYKGKWSNPANFIPLKQITFTESQLSRFDGTIKGLPIYLAIDGEIFDVSAGARSYGPGGGYHHFAGRDAARSFATGCFKTHLTHDLRGLSDGDLEKIKGWKHFYNSHATYRKIGKVLHPPIDPLSPIPEPCSAKSEGGAI